MSKGSFFRMAGFLLMTALGVVLIAGPAAAYVYDNFTATGINPSLWFDAGPNHGLFSQPGGSHLYFTDSTGHREDMLGSTSAYSGAFFVSMQYSDFEAGTVTNRSSIAALSLGTSANNIVIYEYGTGQAQGFNALKTINGAITSHLVSSAPTTTVNSGWLGIGYNGVLGSGGQVTLWYNPAGTGWIEALTYAPNFTVNPPFTILAADLDGASLTFTVDSVQVLAGSTAPVPLPPSLLLLAPGLAGLVAVRRRVKK
jgi:hypothetical protein